MGYYLPTFYLLSKLSSKKSSSSSLAFIIELQLFSLFLDPIFNILFGVTVLRRKQLQNFKILKPLLLLISALFIYEIMRFYNYPSTPSNLSTNKSISSVKLTSENSSWTFFRRYDYKIMIIFVITRLSLSYTNAALKLLL